MPSLLTQGFPGHALPDVLGEGVAADVRRVGDPAVVDTLVGACCSGSGTHRRQWEVVVERVLSNPRAARSRACLYTLQVAVLSSGEAMRAYRHESTYSASVRPDVSRVAFRYSLASCLSVTRPRTRHRSRRGTCERVQIIVGVGIHPNLEAPVQLSPAAHANPANSRKPALTVALQICSG